AMPGPGPSDPAWPVAGCRLPVAGRLFSGPGGLLGLLVEAEHLVGDELDLAGHRIAGVLAAGEDLDEGLAAAAQLDDQPAHVALAAVGGALVGALDLAQAPLHRPAARRRQAAAQAVGADQGALIGDDLAGAIAGGTAGPL